MSPEAARTFLIVCLTAFGFVAAFASTGNTYYIALMFWVLALEYALITNPRRWL